ncbi:MAG: hypothetical protein SRB1_01297 [Desulfobacteraceae bacterium Eth-SRB1]|uniref:Uncharacterized protein n=1 Tax=Candidatus Argoarchaeum ethanivorans TaxID=2608793 RepID=A0A8B3S2Q9_9EURY|nr:MAG: hypothetical protein AEth_00630 [Candidatus Argoarchaeum ethanivorans]RZB32496.1 MAG: hypothetical protein SRB1_01297 [Desulfobacteraceae bacterium Eth-SRB1]
MIEVQNLTKTFNGKTVLNDIKTHNASACILQDFEHLLQSYL